MTKKNERIKIILGLVAIGLIMALSYIIFPSKVRREVPDSSNPPQARENDYLSNGEKQVSIEVDTEKISEEDDDYVISIQYPVIRGITNEEKLANLNKKIKDFISAPLSDFKKQIEQVEISGGTKNGLYITFEPVYFSDKMASIKFNVSEYYNSAVHPGNYVLTFNYNIDEDKEVFLRDLFLPGTDYLGFLSKISRKILSESSQDSAGSTQDWINSGTEPEEENFQHFTLGKNRLTIYFNPYQVGPYALDIQKIEVSFKDLEGYINPEYNTDD